MPRILDDHLRGIVEELRPQLREVGLVQERGGSGNGVAWAQVAGRASDGSWLDLRLYKRLDSQELMAILFRYPADDADGVETVAEFGFLYEEGERSIEEAARLVEEHIQTTLQQVKPN